MKPSTHWDRRKQNENGCFDKNARFYFVSQPAHKGRLCNVNLKKTTGTATKSGAATAERSSSTTCSRVTASCRCAWVAAIRRDRNGHPMPGLPAKLNTTQEEFNEQIEVTYMWD